MKGEENIEFGSPEHIKKIQDEKREEDERSLSFKDMQEIVKGLKELEGENPKTEEEIGLEGLMRYEMEKAPVDLEQEMSKRLKKLKDEYEKLEKTYLGSFVKKREEILVLINKESDTIKKLIEQLPEQIKEEILETIKTGDGMIPFSLVLAF